LVTKVVSSGVARGGGSASGGTRPAAKVLGAHTAHYLQ